MQPASYSPSFTSPTSMASKLSSILQDLYTLDPSLREREAELVPVIVALLKAKPDITLDANFTATLRKNLLTPASTPQRLNSMSPSVFNKFAFAGLGGLIALVVAIPVTYEFTQSGASFEEFALSEVSSVPTIKSVGDDAFGTITATNDAPLGAEEARSSLSSGMGGAPSAVQQPLADDNDANTATSEKMVADIAIDPYPGAYIQYDYIYKGDALDLTTVSDAVYRKNGGLNIGNLGNDLTRAKLGPVDFGSFRGLEIQSFSVKQEDKNGYAIYVDPANGMISINGNEGVWGYNGDEYVPFTEDQIMANEDLVAAADKFLNDYDIDTTGFGAPAVDARNMVYALSQPVDFRYIPETMNVTYPLLLEGQPAHNGDGSSYGLTVTINMRTEKVASVYVNLASSYDKSSYELERDATKILGLAAQGGLYAYTYEGATETVEIELGTPEIILTSHYSYDGSTSEVLFIPALSFPIVKNSDTNPVYSDSVVIPLVKSVIDEAASNADNPILYETLKPRM